jgi:hypothetical protein
MPPINPRPRWPGVAPLEEAHPSPAAPEAAPSVLEVAPPPIACDWTCIVRAARGLARSLVAAGWQPADRGPDWYSQRFVWARSDEPISLR